MGGYLHPDMSNAGRITSQTRLIVTFLMKGQFGLWGCVGRHAMVFPCPLCYCWNQMEGKYKWESLDKQISQRPNFLISRRRNYTQHGTTDKGSSSLAPLNMDTRLLKITSEIFSLVYLTVLNLASVWTLWEWSKFCRQSLCICVLASR